MDARRYFLRTLRLGFGLWTEDDLPLAVGLWGDREVTTWIDVRGQLSLDDVRERLAREIATQRLHGSRCEDRDAA